MLLQSASLPGRTLRLSAVARHPYRSRRGAAAVELAVLLPFLVFLLIIGADWARLLYFKIEVDGAARAGALWAADPSRQGEAPTGWNTLLNAVRKASPSLPADTAANDTITTSGGITVHQVTVTMSFATLTNFPGVPTTSTIKRTVEMRELPLAPN